MDWINDTQRLLTIDQTCSRREELPYITLVFLYIDKLKEVVSVKKETIEFSISSSEKRCISKEKVLELVLTNKKENYTLRETCLFHIPIEPEYISVFNEESFPNYWTSYPIPCDIHLSPSVFIFHPYNTIYFLYHEEEKEQRKSSFKQSSIGKLTKRVRWGKRHTHTEKRKDVL